MRCSRGQVLLVSLLVGGLRGGLAQMLARQMLARQMLAVHVPARSRPCHTLLEGEVQLGTSFRRSFGSGLDLALEAVPHGWIIRVLPSAGARLEVDFAELATPPFRSINPLLLTTDFGLRSQDLVGWNPRRFRYLRGRSSLPQARRAYAGVLSSETPTAAQQAAITQVAAAAAEAEFNVLDAELRPGTADQTAAAALLATHFAATPHTIKPVLAGPSARLGEVTRLRFRASFDLNASAACKEKAALRIAP